MDAELDGVITSTNLDLPAFRQHESRAAKAALVMASTLMAAGVFTGVMGGTGMLQALAQGLVSILPSTAAKHIPFALGLVSMPLSLMFDPDSYYFGVMPVLAEVTQHAGGQAVSVAQASLLGVMTGYGAIFFIGTVAQKQIARMTLYA